MYITTCKFKRRNENGFESVEYEKGVYVGATDNSENSSILDSNYHVVPWENICDWRETSIFSTNLEVCI